MRVSECRDGEHESTVSVAANAREGGIGVPAAGTDVAVGYSAFAAALGEFRPETGRELSGRGWLLTFYDPAVIIQF